VIQAYTYQWLGGCCALGWMIARWATTVAARSSAALALWLPWIALSVLVAARGEMPSWANGSFGLGAVIGVGRAGGGRGSVGTGRTPGHKQQRQANHSKHKSNKCV
jgi:hypothetical protein